MTRKFWNVDGGSPEADLTQPTEIPPVNPNRQVFDLPGFTLKDDGEPAATLSEADARRLAQIDDDIVEENTGEYVLADLIFVRGLLDAANAKIAALTAERDALVRHGPCAKILEHQWLDPVCVENGCQSLILKAEHDAARADSDAVTGALIGLLAELDENPTGMGCLKACNYARNTLARLREERKP